MSKDTNATIHFIRSAWALELMAENITNINVLKARVGEMARPVMATALTETLAALHHKNQTGQGQYRDLALLDTQVASLANQGMNYLIGGQVPQAQGTAHPNIVPYQAFETRDGYIILAVGNDTQFQRFCELAGVAWFEDSRFTSNSARVKNRQALVPEVAEIMRAKDSESWLAELNDRGIPCGPINNLEQVFADEQVLHRGLQLSLDHPLGKVASVANPIRLSSTPIEYDRAPPLLGQHTREVLSSLLGLDQSALQQLADDSVIA